MEKIFIVLVVVANLCNLLMGLKIKPKTLFKLFAFVGLPAINLILTTTLMAMTLIN